MSMMILGTISSLPVFANHPPQYDIANIKNYGVREGLSQVTVHDIAQDNDGYIWLATQSGIDKFDGYTFTHFGQHQEAGKGLSGSLVYSIEVDKKSGDLWVGTINGLDVLRFSDQTFEAVELRKHDGELEKQVQTILIDNKQNIFVSTPKVLFMQKSGEAGFVPISMPNQDATIYDVISQQGKRLLVASSDGVLSYNLDTGEWQEELLTQIEATALALDNAGFLWVGTSGNGIYRADVLGQSFGNIVNITLKDGFSDSYINDIEQMNDNSIWVATNNGASIFPDPNQIKFVNIASHNVNGNSKRSDSIQSLFNTDTSLILFGTYTKGFGVLDLNSSMFQKLDLKHHEFTYFITQQADDTLWLSTKQGVIKVNKDSKIEGPWQRKQIKKSIFKISAMVFDETKQRLWLASKKGVGKIDEGNDYIEDVALLDDFIYSIQLHKDGNLWAGSRHQGLRLIDSNTYEVLKYYDIPMATTILPISEDELWVATTGGLFLINPLTDEIRKFVNDSSDSDSLAHDVLTWISKRDENSFYIGTLGHGLHLLELDKNNSNPKFSPLFANEELTQSSIGAVVDDNNGFLWVSTSQFIFRVNLASESVEVFDENDGVNSNGYYIGAYAVKSDDTIIFVGDQGATYFHPEEINKPDSIPNLQFTRVAVLNSNDSHGIEEKFGSVKNIVDSVTKIILSPEDILISIEFAALEFGSPESIEYAYRLIGFDDRWQYLNSKNRTVTYTNLDPGSYIFEVKSTNRYGVWSDNPQRMPVLVTPPWYKTTLAITCFGLLTIILVFLVFRWRTYALHQRSAMLFQRVKEKTAELQLANNQLTLLTTLDPLTQVYNRRGFTDAVSKEFSKYKRNNELFSVILIDIDFFKKINDKYGHEAGDQVLVKFAKVLQECTRDYDILARWGGEEFIVLLPNTKLKDAINIANKYRETIRDEDFIVGSSSIRVSLTAGVANIDNFSSVDECIKRADNLLYEGKSLGRNQVLPML
ncbi:MAG: diguanylate cyclase (GGDEF)-like protein [Glaciecola sp.]|jgi:diguanylate cyclase (GGDEF)-like protein